MQYNVDREAARGGVSFGDRIGALELGVGPVRVGEPEPQPCGGLNLRILEERRRNHPDPHEMRCNRNGFDHRCGVVARAETAQHHTLQPACHQRSSLAAA